MHRSKDLRLVSGEYRMSGPAKYSHLQTDREFCAPLALFQFRGPDSTAQALNQRLEMKRYLCN